MLIGSLCSGYGGLEMSIAAALPGARTAWHSEIDPDASHVLKVHAPDVPNHGSIVDLAADPSALAPVDMLAMGVPCQGFSAAGRQLAEADPRHLWPYALRILTALRPPAFVFENVRNLISIRKGEVWASILADMREAGYAVRWLTVGACAVGAPHHRHRVFALGVYVGREVPIPPLAVRVVVDECGAPRGAKGRDMLLTPRACDGDGRTGATTTRSDGYGPAGLMSQIAPLATPMARDADRDGMGGPGHAADGGLNLRTPVQDFGPYAAAVARWEGILGRPAPEPTEIGPRGGRRLAQAFPEWMMGLPAGYVSDHVGRSAALRLAGNGVCPQQGAHALDVLLRS